MNVNDVILRLTELKSRIDSGFSFTDKSEVAKLYGEVLGKTFRATSCRDCYRDAIIEMLLYLRKNGAMKERCKYTLLNGAIIREFGTGKVYSNANLTDKIAEAYLKKYPQQIKMFATYPDDWQERVNGVAKKRVKKEVV